MISKPSEAFLEHLGSYNKMATLIQNNSSEDSSLLIKHGQQLFFAPRMPESSSQ